MPTVRPDRPTPISKGWLIFEGVLLVIVGVLILWRPFTGVFALAVLAAVYFFSSGIGAFVSARQWDHPGWAYAFGVLSIIGGIIAVLWPGITLLVLAVLAAVTMIVRSVALATLAVVERPSWWAALVVLGVLGVVLGVLMLVWPSITILALALLLGIDALVGGITDLAIAFSGPRAAATSY